ncbi:MAG: hypothetical protein ABI629_01830 [bacterium]
MKSSGFIVRFSLVLVFSGLGAQAPAWADAPNQCTPGETRQMLTLELRDAGAQAPISVVVALDYDAALVRMPDSGSSSAVRQRLRPRIDGAVVTPNDHGSQLRVMAARGGGIAAGPLVDVELDRCLGARAPTAEDFTCIIESCAGSGGGLSACGCVVRLN